MHQLNFSLSAKENRTPKSSDWFTSFFDFNEKTRLKFQKRKTTQKHYAHLPTHRNQMESFQESRAGHRREAAAHQDAAPHLPQARRPLHEGLQLLLVQQEDAARCPPRH